MRRWWAELQRLQELHTMRTGVSGQDALLALRRASRQDPPRPRPRH